jgi:hypothetical protein
MILAAPKFLATVEDNLRKRHAGWARRFARTVRQQITRKRVSALRKVGKLRRAGRPITANLRWRLR